MSNYSAATYGNGEPEREREPATAPKIFSFRVWTIPTNSFLLPLKK